MPVALAPAYAVSLEPMRFFVRFYIRVRARSKLSLDMAASLLVLKDCRRTNTTPLYVHNTFRMPKMLPPTSCYLVPELRRGLGSQSTHRGASGEKATPS